MDWTKTKNGDKTSRISPKSCQLIMRWLLRNSNELAVRCCNSQQNTDGNWARAGQGGRRRGALTPEWPGPVLASGHRWGLGRTGGGRAMIRTSTTTATADNSSWHQNIQPDHTIQLEPGEPAQTQFFFLVGVSTTSIRPPVVLWASVNDALLTWWLYKWRSIFVPGCLQVQASRFCDVACRTTPTFATNITRNFGELRIILLIYRPPFYCQLTQWAKVNETRSDPGDLWWLPGCL